jgi:Tfp pilus assembly protein PilN
MTAINLVPADIVRGRVARARMRYWGRWIACALAALGLLYGGLSRLAVGSNSEHRRLNGTYSALRQDLRAADTLIQRRDDLHARCQAIRTIRLSRPTGALLRLLARTLTPTSYLTHLSVERCPPFASEGGSGGDRCTGQLRMRGHAGGHRDVGEIIRRLEDAQVFTTVTLVGVTEPAGAEETEGVAFEVVCTLQAG